MEYYFLYENNNNSRMYLKNDIYNCFPLLESGIFIWNYFEISFVCLSSDDNLLQQTISSCRSRFTAGSNFFFRYVTVSYTPVYCCSIIPHNEHAYVHIIVYYLRVLGGSGRKIHSDTIILYIYIYSVCCIYIYH